MEQTSITARISAFARAYHSENNRIKIFDDSVARQLLTDVEYEQISRNMTDGIAFLTHPSPAAEQMRCDGWLTISCLPPRSAEPPLQSVHWKTRFASEPRSI